MSDMEAQATLAKTNGTAFSIHLPQNKVFTRVIIQKVNRMRKLLLPFPVEVRLDWRVIVNGVFYCKDIKFSPKLPDDMYSLEDIKEQFDVETEFARIS